MNDQSSQSQLFEDIRQSESSYLKELSELIACCKYNTSRASHVLQVDVDINNNLKDITSSLLSSHLFLNQNILTLEDSDPLLLVNFVNWLSEAASLYRQYITFYRYDQDQPDKELYLKRRPLVRIRYITKFLKRMLELDVNTSLKQNISDFLEQFLLELSNARTKDDQERQKAASNSISFNEVKNLETMTLTAANFKMSDIKMRDEFQMTLRHPIAKELEITVELFALADSYSNSRKEGTTVSSLAICSVEKLRRSLMFPPFRSEELKIASEDEFAFESKDATVVLLPYYSSAFNPEIVITLKMLKQTGRFDNWMEIFTQLFSTNNRDPNPQGEFSQKYNKLKTLQTGSGGLDIKLLPPAQLKPNYKPKTSGLHKSKHLDPSSNVAKDLEALRSLEQGQWKNSTFKESNFPSPSFHSKNQNERMPLSDKTNSSTPQTMHAYRSMMFQKSSSNINAYLNQNQNENMNQSVIAQPVQIRKLADSPLINMKQAILNSAAFSDFNKVITKNVEKPSNVIFKSSPAIAAATNETTPMTDHFVATLSQVSNGSESVKSPPVHHSKVELEPVSHAKDVKSTLQLDNVDDDSSRSARSEAVSTFPERMTTNNGSKSSILNIEEMVKTDAPFQQTEKRSRRKSIFSVFGLKKKSTDMSEKREIFNPQLNGSTNTLTTQETIIASKSNRNINKLTVDTSFNTRVRQSAEFEQNSANRTQTTVTTPASALPSPFSAPVVDSPTVELSEEAKTKFNNSRSLCNYNCRVSRWSENKWEIIGGKEILVKVIVDEDGGHLIGCDASDNERVLVVLPILSSTSIRRSTALDIQLKTKDSPSATRMTSTLVRCSIGSQAETLMKALEVCKQDMNRPALNTKDSVSSLQSSMFSSSQSLLSKNAFNSMTSITNNNNLTDDIFSLGRPKVGNNGVSALTSPRGTSFNSPTDLYFTPPSSAVDLSFNSSLSSSLSSPHNTQQQQLLLLLLSLKIRVHEKKDTKWEPKCISNLELFALESVPDVYQLNIPEASVDNLVKNENVLRVGKAGILLSLPKEVEEESLEYMLEFKSKKFADDFYNIVGATTTA